MQKILIISNNILSESDSNGRTLKNFLINYKKDHIAQFCINSNNPDYSVCNNYYVVSDKIALKSSLHFSTPKRINVNKNHNKFDKQLKINKMFFLKKTAFSMLLRNKIWSSMNWCCDEFYDWIESFKPKVILLQAGDLPFMFDFSTYLSLKYNIPLVIYNSENYYYKKTNYFRNSFSNFLYPLFLKKLKNSISNAMKITVGVIYNTKFLKKLYLESFPNHNCISIATSSSIDNYNNTKFITKGNPISINYIGNLSNLRHLSLIKIAETINKIDSNTKLNIYGKIKNPKILRSFEKCKNINYCGFVPYNKVKTIISNSTLLVNAESFEPFYISDLKYGFSTKLADYLASGIPLFSYASSSLISTQYLKENKCAFICESEKDLYKTLKKAIVDKQAREKMVENAINISKKNHDIITNANRFNEFINNCIKIYSGK